MFLWQPQQMQWNRQVLLFSRSYKPCADPFMWETTHPPPKPPTQQKNPINMSLFKPKREVKRTPYAYSAMSFRRGCFISVGYICIYQLVRHVYVKASVRHKPHGKQRSGKKKSSKISFPCPVSSAHLPANSAREHGTSVTAPGDRG